MSEIEKKLKTHAHIGDKICSILGNGISELALEPKITIPKWEEANLPLMRNPALDEQSLEAVWLNECGTKQGSVTIHADDVFFTEYDVIHTHPIKPRWFIAAVSA
jgi:hypothetical protein